MVYRSTHNYHTTHSMEMDSTAPGYIKLKATPWLFAILKSTEPFLEEYFDFAPALQGTLSSIGTYCTVLYVTRQYQIGMEV